jgi:hypothetical protein
MAATTDAKEQTAKAPPNDSHEQAAADERGPSVAAHPRASLYVARATGWGGLLGFLLAGYLSLPTSTVAAAGVRALAGGVVCYLAAWAGAVFVSRQLVMLEYAGARARSRGRAGLLAPAASSPTGLPYNRANVRVRAQRPVVAYVGEERAPVQTFTIDLSAGGSLLAGLNTLQKGEALQFELTLTESEPPVTGAATVIRTDAQGRCAVEFKSISRADQRRLDQFVFHCLRSERQGAPG